MKAQAATVLAVALAASGVLMLGGPGNETPAPSPPGPVAASVAWPAAQHADISAELRDGTLFTPGLFLDARTAVGTAGSVDRHWQRLLIRDPAGGTRQLSRLPAADNPQYDDFALAGDNLLWTQSSDNLPLQIWTAGLHAGAAPRLLAAGGNAVFYGNQYDFVYADGRVHWAATTSEQGDTEIRSVPLTGGGPVSVRTQTGSWGLSVWPWLTDDMAGQAAGTTQLHNLITGRTIDVHVAAPDTATCTPSGCRVIAMNGSGALDGIDVMRPDGSARRRIAGGDGQAALIDVAVLDRFEVLSKPNANSDITGAAALLIYDISTGRTVTISPSASTVSERDGILWWSTGDQETVLWHTLDLRTA